MSNAIKFSKPGDEILIKVRQLKLSNDGQNEFEISVADQGLGLNEEDRKNLFSPNFRSSCEYNRAANPQSNGIGLSTSKRIAENIDGDLWLCPEYRQGCKFILKLCVRAALNTKKPTFKFRGQKFGRALAPNSRPRPGQKIGQAV